MTEKSQSWIYEITVLGDLDNGWKKWLNGFMDLENRTIFDHKKNTTTIQCHIVDQPALRGMLNKLWDINLFLVSVIGQPEDDLISYGGNNG